MTMSWKICLLFTHHAVDAARSCLRILLTVHLSHRGVSVDVGVLHCSIISGSCSFTVPVKLIIWEQRAFQFFACLSLCFALFILVLSLLACSALSLAVQLLTRSKH